jgi:O-antigen ligase
LALVALATTAFLVSGRAFEKSLLLTIVVACLLPRESFRRVIKPEEAMPLVACLLFFINRPSVEVRALRSSWTERWILLLLGAAFISAILGLAAGHPWPNVVNEFALYLDFALAIIVARSGLSDRWVRRLLKTIVVCAAVVSLVYLHRFVVSGGHERAASDQQHILNLVIPLLFAFLLLARSLKERLVVAGALLPMIPAVYVTQTRSLWLYIPFSIALLVVLYAAHRHIRVRDMLILGGVAGFAALAILGYTMLTRGATAGHQAIAARVGTLRHLSGDMSLAFRGDLGFQAFSRFVKHPILGTGLGDHLRYRLVPQPDYFFFMDFSYMWVLWKLGIIGLIPLLGLYFMFLKRTWFVYRHTADRFQRASASGILVAFIALLMVGFESGILIIYRFNLVWAILMGIMESWTRQIKFDREAGAEP